MKVLTKLFTKIFQSENKHFVRVHTADYLHHSYFRLPVLHDLHQVGQVCGHGRPRNGSVCAKSASRADQHVLLEGQLGETGWHH
jgi:hypothetical protein